ncbi:MAG: UvrB/UvrC motif-containing protein [bacterium]|nr:UvrB/UvrC motif-containing protein [bacterium]
MYWANFLHIYQPPTQKPFWIHKIANESYRPIFKQLKEFPNAKLTLNVNGILLEHFDKYGEDDILLSIKELLANGQLELTGSAKYHPLLPFLPEKEIVRQVKLNEETHRKYFGDLYKPKGFFPPEMGFSKDVAKIIKKLGYEWVIVDELSFPKEKWPVDYSKIYTVEGLGDFKIFFRERRMSWIILSGQVGTGNLLVQGLGDRLNRQEYLLTAMDGETFGHHRPGLDHLLFEIYKSQDLQTILISDLLNNFSDTEAVDPTPSTWALMAKDLEENKPFSRWKDENNAIHKMQWELTDLAVDVIEKTPENSPGYEAARIKLDGALHSDQYWWASAKPWWSIEMIERGAKELQDSILTAPNATSEAKEKAEKLYQKIIFTAFDWQREGVVDALSHSEDEEIRQRTDTGVPQLPKKEVNKMIVNLQKEMTLLVERQEFERAAQLRNRIAELKQYSERVDAPQFSTEGEQEWQ